jgi:EAL domain-containing protein (putative c-di-GMP-specific phosphodiesterase class I)
VVARQGGDEFLILLADLEPDEAPGRSGSPTGTITTVLNRLEDSLRRPFSLSGAEVYTSASIGISLHPDHAEAGATLLRYADAAMYASKRTGPGHHLLFAPELADSASRLSFATRLRKAVDLSEWELQYQPLVDLTSGQLVGVEALLRWRQADGSLIMPAHFIPVLEEMGLIGALGDWLIGEVCRQAKLWQDQRLPLFTTFNLSLGELWQADLGTKMLGRVEASGIEPSRLVVEITESIAMTDPVRTERILAELKEAGLRLAIDDFGTGHSSLARLTHLPADILKIDRPFLAGVPSVPSARSMVKAIVEMARGLDMVPVAEGVETEDQRDFLLQAGCTLGQGFLFSPAVPPAEIARLVRRGPRAIRRLVRTARRPA